MKYFFPVIGPHKTYPDEGGTSFETLADAKCYAAKLAEDFAHEGAVFRGYVVCVTDERGSELDRVAIKVSRAHL